jgi:opacity protein-like surface antigen
MPEASEVGALRTAVALGYLCNILESNDEALQQFVLALAETRADWTVGAGAEAAIDRNWSVKVEYLYMILETSAAVAQPPRPSPTL